ncbi:LolA family protein [Streptomyces profundus]|uniref:LolA family protein n=1 Tax=Streptomyces profundus TaxID=2867410 RepID=UPI001D167637|nr:DUF2092 domain-containing protein [Streptomyces sp. MA3_2.13]UED84756.1 DUF2092 domain-containing protein [Streptomyces sp. MA3_2.13]
MALHRNIRRAGLPIAVTAGVAAIGVGVWPALASDGSPELPEMTAEELVVLVAESETAQLSGTVRVETDFGLPSLPDFGGVTEGAIGEFVGVDGPLASLLSGDSTLRVAVDGPERQRLALVDGSDEFAVIRNGDELWAYDSASDVVYQADLSETAARAEAHAEERGEPAPEEEWAELTPQEVAERLLTDVEGTADITVSGTARVADRDVYQLTVSPSAADAPVSSARISVDAETGVPLAVRGEAPGGQVLNVAFTNVDFAAPAGGAFQFTPPADAEVVELNPEEPFGGLLDELLPDGLPGGLALDPSADIPEEAVAELPDELAQRLPELLEQWEELAAQHG